MKEIYIVSKRIGSELLEPSVYKTKAAAEAAAENFVSEPLIEKYNELVSKDPNDFKEVEAWAEEQGYVYDSTFFWDGSSDAYEALVSKHVIEEADVTYMGEIRLQDTVDITDPSYNKDVWCRSTFEAVPGNYRCFYKTEVLKDWGKRVTSAWILHSEIFEGISSDEDLGWSEEMLTIGVDTGAAGFFDEKPDFDSESKHRIGRFMYGEDLVGTDQAWLVDGSVEALLEGRDGFWTSSGIGDGIYPVDVVYLDDYDIDKKTIAAARIRFWEEV